MDLSMVYVTWDDCGGALLACHHCDTWELSLGGDVDDSVPNVVRLAEQHAREAHHLTIDGELL